jgi:hypothetical protein
MMVNAIFLTQKEDLEKFGLHMPMMFRISLGCNTPIELRSETHTGSSKQIRIVNMGPIPKNEMFGVRTLWESDCKREEKSSFRSLR